MLRVECDEAEGIAIPFAGRLGNAFNRDRVEARRGFPMLLSAINAVALLHVRQRERDGAGRIVAELQDYEIAREVFGNAIGRSMGADMSKPARRTLNKATAQIIGTFNASDIIALDGVGVGDSAIYGYISEWRSAGAVKIIEEGKGSSSALYEFTDAEASTFALPGVDAIAS